MSDEQRVSDEALAYFVRLVASEEGETQRADFILDLKDERAKTAQMREALRAWAAWSNTGDSTPDANKLLCWAMQLTGESLVDWEGPGSCDTGWERGPAEMRALVNRVLEPTDG